MKIKEDQIAEKLSICPYCYEPQGNKYACCGENHFEEGYMTEDGEIYLETDITIEPLTTYEIEERLKDKLADEAYERWVDSQWK